MSFGNHEVHKAQLNATRLCNINRVDGSRGHLVDAGASEFSWKGGVLKHCGTERAKGSQRKEREQKGRLLTKAETGSAM